MWRVLKCDMSSTGHHCPRRSPIFESEASAVQYNAADHGHPVRRIRSAYIRSQCCDVAIAEHSNQPGFFDGRKKNATDSLVDGCVGSVACLGGSIGPLYVQAHRMFI